MTTNIQPVKRNAINCGICQAPADRYAHYYQCQKNPNHLGDIEDGRFTDRTEPKEEPAR